MVTISQAFHDRRLFAATLGDLSTWQVWLTVLCAAFALPFTFEQQQLFAAIAGGRLPPLKTVRELWCIAGRRSGKSRVAALIAVFIALFVKHRAGHRRLGRSGPHRIRLRQRLPRSGAGAAA
jgi:hypothetical protein